MQTCLKCNTSVDVGNECPICGTVYDDLVEINKFQQYLRERKQLREQQLKSDYRILRDNFFERWKEYLCPGN
jgi:hypothetical protein